MTSPNVKGPTYPQLLVRTAEAYRRITVFDADRKDGISRRLGFGMIPPRFSDHEKVSPCFEQDISRTPTSQTVHADQRDQIQHG